mmetsp:Transcript_7931/g.16901  ORF Transcript_7931/g.16901 Transcript_7931/m.16901 type:complete len:540 (-) Transcript_7931:458-2077(-)
MKIYTQRQLSNALILGASSRAELVQLGTLKAVLREQSKFQEEQARIDRRNLSVSSCVESVRSDVASLRLELRELTGQLRGGLEKQEFRPVFSSQVFEVMAQAKIRSVKGTDEPCIFSMTPRSFAEDGTTVIQSPRLTLSEEPPGKNDTILSAGVWPKYPGSHGQDNLPTSKSHESGNVPQRARVENSVLQENVHATLFSTNHLEGSGYTADNSPQSMPRRDCNENDKPNSSLNGRLMKETQVSGADDPLRVLGCSVDANHDQGSRLDALTPSSSSSGAEDYVLSPSGGSSHNFCQPGNGFTACLSHHCNEVSAVGDNLGTELQVQPAQDESILYSPEMKAVDNKSPGPTDEAGPHTNQCVGSNGYKHGVECQAVQKESALNSQQIKAIEDKCPEPNNAGSHTNQRVQVGSNGYKYGLDSNQEIRLPNLKPAGVPSFIRSAAEIKWSKRESGHSVVSRSKERSDPDEYLGRATEGTRSDKSITRTVGGGQLLSNKLILEESFLRGAAFPNMLGKKEDSVSAGDGATQFESNTSDRDCAIS